MKNMSSIRLLEEKDRLAVLDYLSEEPSINLFIIGDIEVFGFSESFQQVWGQYDVRGYLEGILLRYNENHIPYWKKKDFDISHFTRIIQEAESTGIISGKASIVKRFEPLFPNLKTRSMFFCEMLDDTNLEDTTKKAEYLVDNALYSKVKVATIDDAKRVYDLLNQIEEFTGVGNSIERIQRKFTRQTGRIYYIEDKQHMMVATAQTTAENSKSAMVVSVATMTEHRGKGLMSSCLSLLCKDILAEGKSLCLFYDNPEAGSVYHRLGFRSIDNWVMMTEK